MDAVIIIIAIVYITESGRKKRNLRVSTRCSLGVENEQADAGRDDRNCFARPSSQAPTETDRLIPFFPLFS